MTTEYNNQATGTYNIGANIGLVTSSNTVISVPVNLSFPMVKSQAFDVLFLDTIQEYTIVTTNTTGALATSFTFSDIIPNGLQYVADSFEVDGVLKTPMLVGNILTYTVSENWENGEEHTFKFQCQRTA